MGFERKSNTWITGPSNVIAVAPDTSFSFPGAGHAISASVRAVICGTFSRNVPPRREAMQRTWKSFLLVTRRRVQLTVAKRRFQGTPWWSTSSTYTPDLSIPTSDSRSPNPGNCGIPSSPAMVLLDDDRPLHTAMLRGNRVIFVFTRCLERVCESFSRSDITAKRIDDGRQHLS